MSDRGALILSVAVLAAAAMVAFKPGAASFTAASPGAAVVQEIEFKEGRKAVVAIMPDGRYTLWRQFGSDDFYPPSHGIIGRRE